MALLWGESKETLQNGNLTLKAGDVTSPERLLKFLKLFFILRKIISYTTPAPCRSEFRDELPRLSKANSRIPPLLAAGWFVLPAVARNSSRGHRVFSSRSTGLQKRAAPRS